MLSEHPHVQRRRLALSWGRARPRANAARASHTAQQKPPSKPRGSSVAACARCFVMWLVPCPAPCPPPRPQVPLNPDGTPQGIIKRPNTGSVGKAVNLLVNYFTLATSPAFPQQVACVVVGVGGGSSIQGLGV